MIQAERLVLQVDGLDVMQSTARVALRELIDYQRELIMLKRYPHKYSATVGPDSRSCSVRSSVILE
jgi:hypothetical protein